MNNQRDWIEIALNRFIWIVLIVLVIVFGLTIDNYLTLSNTMNILIHASVLGVMVIGQSLCLMSHKLDLSAEGIVSLVAVLAAWLMLPFREMDLAQAGGIGWELHPLIVIPIILAVGALAGFLNGFMIMKIGMNFFIVTLAMQLFLRGLAFVISLGAIMPGTPALFNYLGGGRLGIIPVSVIVVLSLYFIFDYIMKNTRFGRQVYAIGGNEEAARAAGFSPSRTVIIVYTLSGLLAALAGWMLLGRLETSVPNLGLGLTLEVVAAAVIGGVALAGGEGSIIGAFAGVLLLAVVNNALNLMNIDPLWVNAVRGFIILAALIIDAQKSRYKGRVHRETMAADFREEAPMETLDTFDI
jgi:ribose/xylose/arabinose/galactoside ABC-type transport system permease subunit